MSQSLFKAFFFIRFNLININYDYNLCMKIRIYINFTKCLIDISTLSHLIIIFKFTSDKLFQNYIFYQSNSMDIYQLSKYQNIGDRLKRLANNPATNKDKLSETLNPQTYRYQNGTLPRKDNYSFQQELKPKFSQNSKYGHMPSQQKKSPHQYLNRIKDLSSTFESNQTTQERMRKSINNKFYQQRLERMEQRQSQKQVEGQKQQSSNRKILEKVRSEGTIKIEEILESFNNYKQNKERFMATLGQRQIAQSQHVEQPTERPRQSKEERGEGRKSVFKPIDNIWNEDQSQQNNPKFKRSINNFRDGYEQLDIFSAFREPQLEQQNKPKNFSKSKLIQRNLVTSYEPQIIQTKNALKAMMSPRSRIPGKICKNKERLLTSQNY